MLFCHTVEIVVHRSGPDGDNLKRSNHTALPPACAGVSEALGCKCHIVLFGACACACTHARTHTHMLRLYGQKEKVQHQIKTVFHPQLPGRFDIEQQQ